MAIDLKCEACGREFRVPREMAGEHGRCVCGADVPIPAPETSETPGNGGEPWRLSLIRGAPLWLLAALVGYVASLPWLPFFSPDSHYWSDFTDSPWPLCFLCPLLGVVVAVIIPHRWRLDIRGPVAGILAGLGVNALVLTTPFAAQALHRGVYCDLTTQWHWTGVWLVMNVVSTLTSAVVTTWRQERLADSPLKLVWLRGVVARAGRFTKANPAPRWSVATGWGVTGGLLFGLQKAWPLLKTVSPRFHYQSGYFDLNATTLLAVTGWMVAVLTSCLLGLTVAPADRDRRRRPAVIVSGFLAMCAGLLAGANLFRPSLVWLLAIAFTPAALVAAVLLVNHLVATRGRSGGPVTRLAPTLGLAVLTMSLIIAIVPELRLDALAGYAHVGALDRPALQCLAECRGQKDIPALIGLFGDPDGRVLKSAVTALSSIGQPAVKPLLRALSSANPAVRQGAAQALGRIGDRGAKGPLLAALRDGRAGFSPPPHRSVMSFLPRRLRLARVSVSHSGAVILDRVLVTPQEAQAAAALALGRLHDRSTFPYLANLLVAGDARLRKAGAAALGELGDRRAVPLLIASLADYNTGVRQDAVTSLEQLGDPRATAPLTALLFYDSRNVGEEVLAALQGLHQDVHAALKNVLYHGRDAMASSWAAEELGKIGDRAAVHILAQALRQPLLQEIAKSGLFEAENGPDGAEARAVIKQWDQDPLNSTKVITITPALRAAAGHGSDESRRRAIEQSRLASGAVYTAVLLEAMRTGGPQLRQWAAGELSYWALGLDRPALDAALHDKRARVRVAVVQALAKTGDAKPELLSALGDSSSQVRLAAVNGLAKRDFSGDDRPRLRVAAVLKTDANGKVRTAAARALGAMGYPVSATPLAAAVKSDPDNSVRAAALEALGHWPDVPQARSVLDHCRRQRLGKAGLPALPSTPLVAVSEKAG